MQTLRSHDQYNTTLYGLNFRYSSLLLNKLGIRAPIHSYPLQTMVTQPFKPFLDPLVSSSARIATCSRPVAARW